MKQCSGWTLDNDNRVVVCTISSSSSVWVDR